MELGFHVPINSVSFGQCSYALLKAAKKAGHKVLLYPIGPIDLSTMNPSEEMKKWIGEAVKAGITDIKPDMKCLKLWHLGVSDEHVGFRGSYERLCHNTT